MREGSILKARRLFLCEARKTETRARTIVCKPTIAARLEISPAARLLLALFTHTQPANTTCKFNPLAPFANFIRSRGAAPSKRNELLKFFWERGSACEAALLYALPHSRSQMTDKSKRRAEILSRERMSGLPWI